MISCGKEARKTGGNRYAIKRSTRSSQIGRAKYAVKRERWAKADAGRRKVA